MKGLIRTQWRWLVLGMLLLGGLVIAIWPMATAQGPVPDPQPWVELSSSSYTVGEADGTVTITVTLSASSSNTITVDYATSDGTATGDSNGGADGGDYATVSGTLTFSPGQTSKTIVVDVYDDFCCESNETFTVTLSNPTGADLGSPTASTVTIMDNETGCP
jgi:hypothetical protein